MQVFFKDKATASTWCFGRFFGIVDSVGKENSLIDLFDGSGKYIAQFESTIPVEGMFFKNGKVYAVSTDNDYEFVKRYSCEIQEY